MNYSSDGKIHPEHFGDAFLTEEPKKIYNQCIPEFQEAFIFENFERMVKGFNKSISKFYLQHTPRLGGHTHYLWVDSREKKALSVYFDTEYMIHRLVIRPYITFKEFGSSVSGVKYSMPVKDDWLVFWGGEMNESQLAGNHIIIQHAQREYSLVAHLKESSLTVGAGEVVQQGEVIGRCGNSGNSSEAHIHFHVMDRPKVNKGKSLQIQFADHSRPVQGDIVSQTHHRYSETFDHSNFEQLV